MRTGLSTAAMIGSMPGTQAPLATPSASPTPTTTATTTSTPPPASNTASTPLDGALIAAVLSGAVIAAALTGWVNTTLARRVTRLDERARVRSTLAEAYQAYADYKEFPYAIRRRQADRPAEERIRLSEEVRQVQSRLSYFQAWTQAESPATGKAYNELIAQLRRVAGASMHEAWGEPALSDDNAMNIGGDRVDLSELRDVEQRFLRAAEAHVAALTNPRWRRALNRVQQRRGASAG